MEEASVPVITKEELRNFHFVMHEVLESQTEVEQRKYLLEEAMLLGNGEKHKVKMIFETTEGPVMVETTVWDATDSHIELKSRLDVPVCCIRAVIL